jgi:hypothetical protein
MTDKKHVDFSFPNYTKFYERAIVIEHLKYVYFSNTITIQKLPAIVETNNGVYKAEINEFTMHLHNVGYYARGPYYRDNIVKIYYDEKTDRLCNSLGNIKPCGYNILQIGDFNLKSENWHYMDFKQALSKYIKRGKKEKEYNSGIQKKNKIQK